MAPGARSSATVMMAMTNWLKSEVIQGHATYPSVFTQDTLVKRYTREIFFACVNISQNFTQQQNDNCALLPQPFVFVGQQPANFVVF